MTASKSSEREEQGRNLMNPAIKRRSEAQEHLGAIVLRVPEVRLDKTLVATETIDSR